MLQQADYSRTDSGLDGLEPPAGNVLGGRGRLCAPEMSGSFRDGALQLITFLAKQMTTAAWPCPWVWLQQTGRF